MPNNTGSNPQAQRRAAQRRLARELQQGTYQRGQAGRSYQQARARQRTGRELTASESRQGHLLHQRQFSSVRDGAEWARDNLPPRTEVYFIGYGKLHVLSGDPDDMGTMVYRAISAKYQARSVVTFVDRIEAKARELFTDLRFVVIRWTV